MLCLNIRSKQAILGIDIQQGKLEMKAPQAQIRSERTPPQAGIWPEAATVEIDSTESRAAYGCKSISRIIAEFSQKGLQGVQEGTDRRAREGAQALRDGAKPNSRVLQRIARSKLAKREVMRIGLANVPLPTIRVTLGRMQGGNDPGSLKLDIQTFPLQTKYTPTRVNPYLKQEASVRMWATEGRYDIYA